MEGVDTKNSSSGCGVFEHLRYIPNLSRSRREMLLQNFVSDRLQEPVAKSIDISTRFTCLFCFARAFHILSKSLYRVVGEQLIEWAKCQVLNMTELKVQPVDICVAVRKGSDAGIVLG